MSENKIKVLLIEDNLGDIRLISDMIQEYGHEHFELNHNIKLSTGLERIKQNIYDVILLDLNLPDSIGLETLKKVRTEYKDIPIVVITEITFKDIEIDAVKHGAQDILFKGHFEENLLLKTLRYAVERKREEKKIIETTKLLEIIFNSTHTLLVYLDTDLKFLRVNQSFANYEQKDMEFFHGKNYFELYPNDNIKEIFKNVLRNGESYLEYARPNFRSNNKDDISYWDLSIIPVQDDEKNNIGIVLTISEVTERKKIEEELALSNARFNGIIKSAMDSIISINAEQKIILFNNAAEKTFAISAAEALGKDINDFIPVPNQKAHAKYIANFGVTNVSNRSMGNLGTLNAVRADGTVFPIEASISQVDVAGEKIYTVIIRDISNRINNDGTQENGNLRKTLQKN